jgi:hypothetical protein
MGLKLRLCLFCGVGHEDVLTAYQQFYRGHNQLLLPEAFELGSYQQFEFYQRADNWVIVGLDGGWERSTRQAAFLSISQSLSCAGFFIYVYDGDYWGYELFSKGIIHDQFISVNDPDGPYYCDDVPSGCDGDVSLIKSHFPFLNEADISPYLVRETYPDISPDVPVSEQSRQYHEYQKLVDIPPRSGDEFTRFDECSVLNFLRMLGVEVELRAYKDKNGQTLPNRYVTFLAPLFGSFALSAIE